jgi:arylformamidase
VRRRGRATRPGYEFHNGKIEAVASTRTYLDSPLPYVRFADGIDMSELPLESLADLDCVVVRAEVARSTSSRSR